MQPDSPDVLKFSRFRKDGSVERISTGKRNKRPFAIPEPINDALRTHSLEAEDWPYQRAVVALHEWAERFNHTFNLGLHMPAIRLDRIDVRTLGTYQPGRSGLGLQHEITLNTRYLDRPLAETLCTLLHELIHEWQALYGTSGSGNYHNRQFRRKALMYGLVVDKRGCDQAIQPGPFTNLLAEHGIDARCLRGLAEESPRVRPRGESKMRKWRCGCTNVRCAVELVAACLKCGLRFEEAPPAW